MATNVLFSVYAETLAPRPSSPIYIWTSFSLWCRCYFTWVFLKSAIGYSHSWVFCRRRQRFFILLNRKFVPLLTHKESLKSWFQDRKKSNSEYVTWTPKESFKLLDLNTKANTNWFDATGIHSGLPLPFLTVSEQLSRFPPLLSHAFHSSV